MQSSKFNLFFSIALERYSLINSIKVALIVGTLLNLINQGEQLAGFMWAEIDFIKFGLTFLVPFLVATYASSTTKLSFYVGSLAPVKALIKCNLCDNTITVKKNELIPACSNCKKNKRWKIKKHLL
jgi:hypothetical protein